MSMKKSHFLQRVLVGVMAFLMIFAPVNSVMAAQSSTIDETTLYEYAQNGVYFYNPKGSARSYCSFGGDCYIPETDSYEKRFWAGLRHAGFTPEQTAGLMGNFYSEGSTPVRQEQAYINARNNGCMAKKGHENIPYTIYVDDTEIPGLRHGSCISGYSGGVSGIGIGFAQWTYHSRRMGWIERLKNNGLLKYVDNDEGEGEGDAYNVYGTLSDDALRNKIIEETGSDDDWRALWCLGYRYVYEEVTTSYRTLLDKTTAEDAAAYVSKTYENCGESCQEGGASYNNRVESAKAIYARYEAGEFDDVENQSLPDARRTDDENNTDEGDDNDGDTDEDGDNKEDGSSNQSGASSMQQSGDCSLPFNVTTPEAVKNIMNQFLMDTNAMYGLNYAMIDEVSGLGNVVMPVPGVHEHKRYIASVRDDWVSRGIIRADAPLGGKGDAAGTGCWGASDCGQCTAFSGWFVSLMTEYLYGGGDGQNVVPNLVAKNPDLEVTDVPTPFSIFSQQPQHTGVIVGDLGDGKYLMIDNNIEGGHLRVMTISFPRSGFVFANIPPGKIKRNHLGEQ